MNLSKIPSLALVLLLTSLPGTAASAGDGIKVSKTVAFGGASPVVKPFEIKAGRFIPFEREDAKASLLVTNNDDAVQIFPVKPGSQIIGIRFDEPDDAEPTAYNFPDAKGIVYAVIARKVASNTPVPVVIKSILNAPAPVPPATEQGPPLLASSTTIWIVGQKFDPAPIPGPGPGPDPKPPVPVIDKLTAVVVVEETEQAAANRAATFADGAVTDWVRMKAVVWRVVDKDVKQYDPNTRTRITPPELTKYLAAAAGKPLPCAVMRNSKGDLVTESFPATTLSAGLLDLLKKYGGQ